ncbi:MAG: hypothetical protein QOG04_708 [Actinomycetota bacterium]|jgi:hypothetical protein|nr:hypothetical protein [Actinomycetota bacterium]
MADNRRLVDRVVDPTYVEGVTERSDDDLKAMLAESAEAENEVSFERKLCQGRIDILKAELSRREEGGDTSDLVSRLPQILAGDEPRSDPGALPSRAPDFSIPRNADIPRRRVEEIVGEQTLARLPQLPDEEIGSVISALTEHESNLSARRKALHEAIEILQRENIRRMRSGETDPTSALG